MHDTQKWCKEDLEGYDILLLGIPTRTMAKRNVTDDFFPTLEEIDFNGKAAALFSRSVIRRLRGILL